MQIKRAATYVPSDSRDSVELAEIPWHTNLRVYPDDDVTRELFTIGQITEIDKLWCCQQVLNSLAVG